MSYLYLVPDPEPTPDASLKISRVELFYQIQSSLYLLISSVECLRGLDVSDDQKLSLDDCIANLDDAMSNLSKYNLHEQASTD